MQQPQQQQQQQHLQQHQQQLQATQQKQTAAQQLTNNIILVRGARNENGQIVIQNKHGIISIFNNEQQQQQQQLLEQQQKIDKATVAATLTQLPTGTTVARKSIQATSATPTTTATTLLNSTKNVAFVAKEAVSATTTAAAAAAATTQNAVGGGGATNGNGNGAGTATNTILLQTPINASQLESVLLQSANMKKSAAKATTTAAERQYLFKNASRSLSTDSNRLGNISDAVSGGGGSGSMTSSSSLSSSSIASKAPFVLQTLKRLEKSQSILVIRNPSASSLAALTASSSASSLSNVSLATNERATDRISGGGGLSSSASSSISGSTLSLSSIGYIAQPAQTVSVSTNTTTTHLGSVSLTRTSKSQQTAATNPSACTTATAAAAAVAAAAGTATTTKLGNITVNRTSGASAAAKSSLAPAATTTTTTYLRLSNATTVYANGSNNNNSNNSNSLNGISVNKIVVGGAGKSHNSNALSINKNSGTHTIRIVEAQAHQQQQQQVQQQQEQHQLCLSDVQLKLDGTNIVVTQQQQQKQPQPAQPQQQQQQQPAVAAVAILQQNPSTSNTPRGADGEPIKLPDNLESLPRADSFPSQRHRWNTNEEIAAILISFDKHNEWQSKEVKTRPKSGSLLLYSRKKVRYRRDGYCWKKRKDGKTTREDHMKLKVQGTECIYGCYVHSAILPTFHRRCYWLLQNPDIVLVHYLNVPYPDDNKMAVIAPSITLWGDKKEWTKDELVSQLRPMLSTVTSDDDSDSGNDIEISTAETVEALVCQLMEKQRLSRQAALVKQLDCGCGDASCADGKTCSHPVMRRPALLKSVNEKRLSLGDGYGASSTPNVVVGQKLYARWSERRLRDGSEQPHHHHHHQYHVQQQTLPQESAIKFQIIPPQHNEQQQQQQASYQQQQQHYRQMTAARNNMLMQQQQQQQQPQQTNFNQNSSASSSNNNGNHNNQLNLQRFVANHSNANHSHNGSNNNNSNNNNNGSSNNVSNGNNNNISHVNHRLQIAKTTITASSAASAAAIEQQAVGSNEAELIGNPNHMTATNGQQANTHNTLNRNGAGAGGGGNCSQLVLTPRQLKQQQQQQNNINNNNGNFSFNKQQQQQQTDTSSNSTSSTQQQDLYNRMQQQQQQQQEQEKQQTTTDINMSSVVNPSITQAEQHQQQQQQMEHQHAHSHSHSQQPQMHLNSQQQQQQQTTNTTTLNISSTTSTPPQTTSSSVEPMCMSPEHQPSTPVSPTTLGLSGSDSNPLQHHQQQQQQAQAHIISSSPSCIAHQSIMNDNVGHHKQTSMDDSLLSTTSTETARVDENLIGEHGGELAGSDFNSHVEVNNDVLEQSSGGDIKQNVKTSENNNHHNCNGNNQVKEYNNSNSNTDGCVNICASKDGATINNIQEQQQQQQHKQTKANTNSQENYKQQSQSHLSDFESLDVSNNGNPAADQHQHQQQQHRQSSASHSTHDLNDSLSFLNETLDLSHEDIQRTLIANMPFGGAAAVRKGVGVASAAAVAAEAGATVEEQMLNSIDFLNSNCAAGQSDDENLVAGVVGCEGDDEDDVFANLDAFDMLVEFPELDLDDKEALTNTLHGHQQHVQQQIHIQQPQQQQQQQRLDIHSPLEQLNGGSQLQVGNADRKLLCICDFSPEWAYTEGGVKVLVAGPWTANATYTLLFDGQPVPTQLIQEGVLRCHCPPHVAGFATLQVSCNNYIISDTVLFEYKRMLCQETTPFDANTNDCLYKFTLLSRLALIDEKMQVKAEGTATLFEQQTLLLHKNFEEQLVSYCQQLMKRAWLQHGGNWCGGYKGMTLLHLAAALGYSKLVCTLLNWRNENPNIILETEIDALSQDVYGWTPMAWACALNHIELATILYKWNHNALKIKDHARQTPLDTAHVKGHKQLLSTIYRLEEERHKQSKKSVFGNVSLSLNKYSLTDVHSNSLHTNEQIYDVKDNENAYNNFESLDMQRSHDGVFLRPVAVASNQSPPNASRFSKRSSVDSGISMDIRTKPGKSFKDITRLHSFDAHDNYSLAVESTLDTLAATNTTNTLLSPSRKMDFALCEVSTGDSSPLNDKDHDDTSTINNDDDDVNDVTINNENDAIVGDSDAKVLTLAEHIIAAMPERIKNEADELMVLGSPLTEPLNTDSPSLNNGFMDPLDSLPNTHFDSFDFNDHSYRYHDVSTPCSSLSPASSGPLQSPASYSILGADLSVSSPSPPPSTKQLTEFLHASSNSQYPFEADFSKLTLTDTEQRELYEAAKCIQKAYRSYKGRQKLEEQNKERTAAIVIQNYYRRYKQYAYYRQMTNAALVIQHGYRSYCRNKRFKKSQPSSMSTGIELLSAGDSQSSPNSQCLSSFYDHFRQDKQQQQQQQQHELTSQPSTPKETSPSGPLKRTYSQSTQNQAARKIQQFMRQSRIKLQRERAEKERLVHQRREEYLQSLQYQGQPEIVCQAERSEMPAAHHKLNNNSSNNTIFTYHL